MAVYMRDAEIMIVSQAAPFIQENKVILALIPIRHDASREDMARAGWLYLLYPWDAASAVLKCQAD